MNPVLDQYKTSKVKKLLLEILDSLDLEEDLYIKSEDTYSKVFEKNKLNKLMNRVKDTVDFIDDEISELELNEDL